jgi:putative CocE/NonD family hydrolase
LFSPRARQVDTDIFGRLVDEQPAAEGGRAIEVSYGMVRARYRENVAGDSMAHDSPLVPGQPVALRVELGPTACSFAAGHRLRLEVASSCFPNHDRNHGTGGDDLAEATMVVAQNTVFHSAAMPSRIELPLLV